MKLFITFLAIFFFNSCFAQNKSITNSLSPIEKFKVQLIENPVRIIPDCGIAITKITLSFKVFDSKDFRKIRKITFECPNESFGADFFKKDNIYIVTAKRVNSVDIENLFNKSKSNEEIKNGEGWVCKSITKSL